MKNKLILLLCAMSYVSCVLSQDIDYNLVPYRSGDKWGYATPDKKIVFQPKYEDAGWFSEGLAAVKVGDKWGYINKANKMVIPARYTVAKSFRKGFIPTSNAGGDSVIFAGASVRVDGYEICINDKGTQMSKCPAIADNNPSGATDLVKTVKKEKNYTLANNDGLFDKVVDDYTVPGDNETYYIAKKGEMVGVLNSKLQTIIPFEYTSVSAINAGGTVFLEAAKSNNHGILDTKGGVVIPVQYSSIHIVQGVNHTDYAIVKQDGNSFVKDLKNWDLIKTPYSDIEYDQAGGFILTGTSNLKGYYIVESKTTIPPKYSEIKLLPGGRFLEVKGFDGKRGIISPAGDEYFVK